MKPHSPRLWVPVAIGALVLGIAIGANLHLVADTATSVPDPVKQEPKVLYWYDPMVPDQHFDKPGKSPFMDMELVPKYAEAGKQESAMSLSPSLVQNLGLRTAKVERLPVKQVLDVTGQLQFNERRQAILQLRAAGFIEKVWPLAMGDRVISGQPIAELHIPEWLDAQNELLSQPVASNTQRLKTLRTRLLLLGMPESLIKQVEKTRQPETRITLTSPIDGVITLLGVKNGMALDSGATLAQINGTETLWLEAAIPEGLSGALRTGDSARFRSANPEDPALTGHIDQVLPTLNSTTRARIARIVLDNPEGILTSGTTGQVTIQSGGKETALFIPTEAVIRTGKRTLVMVVEAEGQFRPVAVTPGQEMGDQTLIGKGLEEGQTVVASGQFLLDSEASFLGLTPEPAKGEHDHD
ncbi:efflux RND transporter periplasmic adaptor subunit [Cellvibrio sp. KY-GH-1]|uniref:efflux RND transporter periplasmic adaptor subunit n=1 Tax=Cellvibrio sp. KY-GH-1 TaxID=2303332 RepID=UPI0012493576|nr:efflux RND transporter periplasmic adaptor subunit [Cellvibrio sp. KY-GH-1]QEY15947.1 efflux RND transporter periplasmic adaptor subunit [Cellvibrio sp. KY-GH-1]